MTISEYKKNKLTEIDYFLRGINFNNVGIKEKKYNEDGKYLGTINAKLIDNVQVNDELFKTKFLNRKEWFPILTEAMSKIKTLYAGLENKFSDDITGANTVKEVDIAIIEFIQNVMQILDELKEHILEDVKLEKNVSVTKSFETSSLDFLEINIGGKVFKSERINTNPNILKEKEQVDSAVLILVYIYMLPINIERSSILKSNMINLIEELEKCFDHGSEEHKKIASYFQEIYRLRQGEKAGIEKFKEVIKYIDGAITNFWDKKESTPENNKRYKDLIELHKIAQMIVPQVPSNEVKKNR